MDEKLTEEYDFEFFPQKQKIVKKYKQFKKSIRTKMLWNSFLHVTREFQKNRIVNEKDCFQNVKAPLINVSKVQL